MKITVKASILHFNYREGERPPLGPPYKIVAVGPYGATVVLAKRSLKYEAQKLARQLKMLLSL